MAIKSNGKRKRTDPAHNEAYSDPFPTSSENLLSASYDMTYSEPPIPSSDLTLEESAQLDRLNKDLDSTLQALETALHQRDEALSNLPSELISSSSEDTALSSDLGTPNSMPDTEKIERCKAVIDTYVRGLHEFNEMKDLAQGLAGLVAERRGVRMQELMKEYGIGNGE
ncbi:hypothetical protein EV356DRAFT_506078 [Viridothelium virens]|uniref:Swi5-domain-containing protein n=1 Tax=Viridothelium virens TaxID=1048519 RepID=A0A6A6HKP5_VIRVR|nr:hypothetical protein EV356DRAFT_506078 [Viridothelium virens]